MERRAHRELEIEPVDEMTPSAEPTVSDRDPERVEVQEERDEEKAEGAVPYFAPTDPVLDDRGRELLGGLDETSMDSIDVDASTIDEEPGDEALADAVRRELREDALTSDLRLYVQVHRGTVFLRGKADTIEETDDAADVASRVPGVRSVVEQIATPEV